MSTVEIREKLNLSFKTPTVEDDMTGIFGKYDKLDKMYKVKYIYKYVYSQLHFNYKKPYQLTLNYCYEGKA